MVWVTIPLIMVIGGTLFYMIWADGRYPTRTRVYIAAGVLFGALALLNALFWVQ